MSKRLLLDLTSSAAAVVFVTALVYWWNSGGSPPAARAVSLPRDTSVPSEPVIIAGTPTRGVPSAPAAMIVFSDFECRFCGSMARETMPLIDAKYVATGRLLVAFKHLPLEPIHQAAARAAAAVECAGRQNAFWDMHDELFLSQHQQFDDRGLLRRAEAIGLDRAPFLRCLDGDGRQRVEDDVRLAKSLGISSTPTILVGAVLADGRVRILRRLSGSKSAAVLGSAIDSVLAGGEMAGAAAGRD